MEEEQADRRAQVAQGVADAAVADGGAVLAALAALAVRTAQRNTAVAVSKLTDYFATLNAGQATTTLHAAPALPIAPVE